MGRFYTISGIATITPANTDVDWLEIVPADDKPVRLRGLVISQSSEIGDAQEENLRFSILRLPATFTSGSGGSAPTPVPLNDADAAAAMASEIFNPTLATTSGTAATLAEFGWNVRNSPYEMWWPDPDWAPTVRQAAGLNNGLVLRQQTTVVDDINCLITAYVEEF